MSKSIHELATEVIAKVIDLSKEEGLKRIDRECEGNEELKSAVLKLFTSIHAEESSPQVSVDNSTTQKSTLHRVYRSQKATGFVLQKWLMKVFENRRFKLLFLSAFLLLLLAIGVSVRFQVRHLLINDAGIYLEEQLYSQHLRLQEWIDKGKTTIEAIAADPTVIAIAKASDSLQINDPSLNALKEKTFTRDVINQYRLSASFVKVPAGIISKEGARILTELYGERLYENPVAGTRLGKGLYNAYLDAMEETIFIKPLSSEETIYKFADTSNSRVVCVFLAPIHDTSGQLLGVLYNTYLAREEFSKILTRVHIGHRGETYAFDKRGRMLSSGRYLDELKSIPYFGLAEDDETIYNVILKNPGVDVSKGIEPKIPKTQLPFVTPLQEILLKLDKGTSSVTFENKETKPYLNYRGEKVISRWLWWTNYDFGIITEIRLQEALSTLRFFDYAFLILYVIIFALSYWLFTSNVKIFRFGRKLEGYKQLGQYKLGEKLGEGGFGEVYKAEHAFLKTPVAIKLLKKQFNGTDMLDRFEKEVKVTAALSNPNTVKVYDYGTTDDGQFYYVMEFLNGIPVDQLVSKEKMVDVARGVHILLGVCYSLREAHANGLVHRDIKPMNVMLCNQGGTYDVVKVLDFGLVKSIDANEAEQTQINRIGGTPMFMAPERIRDPFNADQKVDIYSLGALGIYMFSGKYLLELVSQHMLSGEQTIQTNLKDGITEGVDVPVELKDLLLQCLSFDPEKRPADIAFIIQELEQIQSKHNWSRTDAETWWKAFDVYV